MSAGPERGLAAEMKLAAAICSRGREAVVAMFNEVRMGRTVDAEGCLPLVEEISRSILRNPGALVSLARLKTKDDYTFLHSVAVCAMMVSLGRQLGLDCGPMSGFDAAGLDAAFWAGTSVRTNFVCTLGQGDPAGLMPRSPRLAFDEACQLV